MSRQIFSFPSCYRHHEPRTEHACQLADVYNASPTTFVQPATPGGNRNRDGSQTSCLHGPLSPRTRFRSPEAKRQITVTYNHPLR